MNKRRRKRAIKAMTVFAVMASFCVGIIALYKTWSCEFEEIDLCDFDDEEVLF